jgi:hypothetical protein
MGLNYETFYGPNYKFIVISRSVCHCRSPTPSLRARLEPTRVEALMGPSIRVGSRPCYKY